MKKILVFLAIVTIASVVATACDDDDDPVSGPTIGVGPGLSIGEALTSNLTDPLLINGLLHVQNGQVRLCENLPNPVHLSVQGSSW